MTEIKEYTKFYEEYTKKAQTFHCNTIRNDYDAQLWFELNRNAINLKMLGNICEGKRVLDLGAAHWVEKHFLSQISSSAISLDLAPTSDDKDVIKADACQTPFPDKSFDVIICREVIEHVIDADELMREVQRLLTDGGYLFITTPNAFALPPDAEAHRRGFTPRGFLHLMRRFNFRVIDKNGNLPHVFSILMPLADAGYTWVLDEFKEIAKCLEHFQELYYLGTNMFILAQKE